MSTCPIDSITVVSARKKLFPHCLVLVVSRNRACVDTQTKLRALI